MTNVRQRPIADIRVLGQKRGVKVAKALCTIAPLLLFSGCSYGYDVIAELHGRNIIFKTDARGGWFSPEPCVESLEITSGRTVVWRIERAAPLEECRNDFPIQYGRAPAGFRQVSLPRPLKPNTVYEINGYGAAMYRGAFRYAVRTVAEIENLEPNFSG